jgi:hypothetical protein
MILGLGFHPPAGLKKIARPILLPVLQTLGWRRRQRIPRLSAKDRIDQSEVPSRVSVRGDQTILLNGTPFFPIGLYYAQDEILDATVAGLRKLREMGFNTIFFNGGLDSESQLDRIWSAGLHVCYRPPGALYCEFDLLKKVVAKFARHPATLFWEIDDEPVLNQVKFSQAEIGCRIVRRIDPYHPILCNQWLSSLDQAEEMMKWAGLADIYAFSVYPIPLWRWGKRMSLVEKGWPHSVAVVGAQTDLWKSYAPDKPIIPVLQAWAQNCLEDGRAAYPSYHQCRFMAYQAVIHGAKGLHHYGATDPQRPYFACGIPPGIHEDLGQMHTDFLQAQQCNQGFWNYYSRVISEISLMSGVFTSDDPDFAVEFEVQSPDQLCGRNIECQVKRHLNSLVVLAVNASDSVSEVEFSVRELNGQTLKLWGQQRSIKVSSSGRFQDTLEPYAVRIYSDQPDLLADLSTWIILGDEYGDFGCATGEKV